MNEENSFDIVTLLDEEGVEHEFELVDTVEFKDSEYVALIPIAKDAEDFLGDSGELVIMKIVVDGGEEFLDAVEDDSEYNEISEIMVERLSEYFEFDEDEEIEENENI